MKLYRRIHFLSLDIVLGALAISCFAAQLFHSSPGWTWYVCLAATVWLLYTADHVLDAWRHRKSGMREMHLFIFRNRRLLLWSMGVIAIVNMLLIFNLLDQSMLKIALALGGLILLFYAMRHLFLRNRLFFIPGEVFVLFLYLAGTWMGPYVTRGIRPESTHWLILLMMAGVLLMNLGIISIYDAKMDSRLGIASLANALGKRAARNMMFLVAVGIFILAVLQFMVYGTESTSRFGLILSGMTLLLLLVLLYPSRFRQNDAYRLVADAILYMGFLSLIV